MLWSHNHYISPALRLTVQHDSICFNPQVVPIKTRTCSLISSYLWSSIPLTANDRTKLQNIAMIPQLKLPVKATQDVQRILLAHWKPMNHLMPSHMHRGLQISFILLVPVRVKIEVHLTGDQNPSLLGLGWNLFSCQISQQRLHDTLAGLS